MRRVFNLGIGFAAVVEHGRAGAALPPWSGAAAPARGGTVVRRRRGCSFR